MAKKNCVKMEDIDYAQDKTEYFSTLQDAEAFAEFIKKSFKGRFAKYKVLYYGPLNKPWVSIQDAIDEYKDCHDIDSTTIN